MKKWLKLSLIILLFTSISLIIYFILKAFNLTDINKIRNTIKSSGSLAFIVFIFINTTLITTLCFIPLLNESLTALSLILFTPFTAFISCLISALISNSILFLIGDKFGEKLAIKLIGKEELEKTQNLIESKTKLILPLAFILPGIPDEALCIVAGMTKIKYSYLIVTSTICHCIEIGAICFFGSGIINWSALTIFDWIIFINLISIDIYFLLKLEKNLKK